MGDSDVLRSLKLSLNVRPVSIFISRSPVLPGARLLVVVVDAGAMRQTQLLAVRQRLLRADARTTAFALRTSKEEKFSFSGLPSFALKMFRYFGKLLIVLTIAVPQVSQYPMTTGPIMLSF